MANIETKITDELRDAVGGTSDDGLQIAVGKVAAAILAENPGSGLSLETMETAVARIALRNGFVIIEFGPDGTNCG